MDFAEFQKKLEREAQKTVEATREAVGDVADETLAKSQERVPVVSGNLRDSGQVVRDENGARVEYTADYADQVHENPDSQGYRYLESVVQEEAGRLPDEVADAAKRRLK